ncbi:MAG: ABC transporter substrate-binding protein [Actinomycetota bacterium]|nr:ABC transporter substrate-binding protein [Actinomycetota bacterium]
MEEQRGHRAGGISRRDFLKFSGGLVLAACAPQQAGTTTTTGAAGGTTAGTTATTTGPTATTTAAGPSGPVRFLTAENFWADWSPYASTALSQLRLERQVYDYLVDFPTGDLSQPEGRLATDWRQVDDLTWEFQLREGVTFHEGQKLTAEDVKASVELASGFSGESAYSINWLPAQVEVVDELTARITTEQPFGPMLAALWWYAPILSAEWLEGDPERLRTQPNGSGPFRLVEDETNRKAMEANPDYWRDPAQINELVWEFIQDPQTRLNALLGGEAHAIDRVPPEHLSRLEGEQGVGLISVTGIESVNLFVRPGRLEIWDTNPNFRRAVNWSIDRQPLVEALVLGNSQVAQSYLPTNTQFFAAQQPQYSFDPEMARSELEAAGVPDGGPEFELWVAEGFLPRATQVVQAIVGQMQQVGLKPRVVTSDVAGMIDDIFTEGGTGALYHLSWASSGDPHHAATVYSSAFAWYFGDERLQELVEEGLTTLDPQQREQVYADLQAHMWEQAWHVPLYNSDFTIAHSANLQGLLVQPNVFRTDFYPAQLVG